MPKNLTSCWKPEACSQTELPDRSILIRQKLVVNAKIQMQHFSNLLSNRITRHVNFNWTKIGGNCQNWKFQNETFWVIFKQCVFLWQAAFFIGPAFDVSLFRVSSVDRDKRAKRELCYYCSTRKAFACAPGTKMYTECEARKSRSRASSCTTFKV